MKVYPFVILLYLYLNSFWVSESKENPTFPPSTLSPNILEENCPEESEVTFFISFFETIIISITVFDRIFKSIISSKASFKRKKSTNKC